MLAAPRAKADAPWNAPRGRHALRAGVAGAATVAGSQTVSNTRAKRYALAVGSAAAVAGVSLATVGAVTLDTYSSAQAAPAGYLDLRDETLTSRSATYERGSTETGVTATIKVDGKTIEQTVGGGTVADLLAAADVVVDEDDVVSAELGSAVQDGAEITVQRVEQSIVTEDVVDEFETVTKESDSLYEGEEEVTTEGQDGLSTVTYRVTLVDGEETERAVLASAVSQERVDKVVTKGTKEKTTAVAAAVSASTSTTGRVLSGSNREIGQQLAAERGWTGSEWQCLDALFQRESGWNHLASNSSSGAYGIPQALPGSKMASVASDWRTNPTTQITWGLNYIAGRYGTPCVAWSHSESVGWY